MLLHQKNFYRLIKVVIILFVRILKTTDRGEKSLYIIIPRGYHLPFFGSSDDIQTGNRLDTY